MFSEAVKNKLSCAAFFFLPGLSYSLVTSRMPAIKESAQIDDLQLGIALFCLGIAGCIGLFFSSRLVRLLKDRPTIAAGASLSTIGLVIAGYANSFASLVSGFAAIGFGIGLTDALMNAQGMFYERLYKTRSMNLFHAFFSLGGIVGSLTASLCAYLDLSPLFSFLVLVVPWTVVCLFGCRYLQEEDRQVASSETSRVNTTKRAYPLILICFGLLSWLAYDIEGSVAEWGSVYMVSSKESDQAVAALVYGLFSGTIFIVRLFGDKLRESVGGFSLVAYLLSDCFLRNVVRTFVRGSCNSALRLRCYGTWTRACRPDNIQSRRKMQRNYSFRSQQFHRHRRLWGSVGRTSDAWMDRLSFIARNCLVLGVGFLCIGFCDLIDSSALERPTESQRLIGAVNSSLILR